MLSENGDLIKNRHDRAPGHSTVSIQNGGQTPPRAFNFAPISRADLLKCTSRVHLSMRTEGITAFSKRIRRCSVDGENDTKTISVDANCFENGAKQLRFQTV